MEIKVDKDIPVPSKLYSSRTSCPYPLKELEVNESFLVPNPNNLPLPQLRNQVNAKLNYYSKTLNYKFTVRNTDEGLRVWRVK